MNQYVKKFIFYKILIMYDNLIIIILQKLRFKKLKDIININNLIIYTIKKNYLIRLGKNNVFDFERQKNEAIKLSNIGYKVGVYLSYSNISNFDILELCNVHTLDLCGCKNISDVSMLGNVHTLYLSYCKNITDISKLGNVHTLDLSYTYITNVSMLGNVHTLDLFGCKNITNVSMLENVHTLNLGCCYNITDDSGIEKLCNTHILSLMNCMIRNSISMLGNVHTLNLSFCYNINEEHISALYNVNNLQLEGCRKIIKNQLLFYDKKNI